MCMAVRPWCSPKHTNVHRVSATICTKANTKCGNNNKKRWYQSRGKPGRKKIVRQCRYNSFDCVCEALTNAAIHPMHQRANSHAVHHREGESANMQPATATEQANAKKKKIATKLRRHKKETTKIYETMSKLFLTAFSVGARAHSAWVWALKNALPIPAELIIK